MASGPGFPVPDPMDTRSHGYARCEAFAPSGPRTYPYPRGWGQEMLTPRAWVALRNSVFPHVGVRRASASGFEGSERLRARRVRPDRRLMYLPCRVAPPL